MKFSPTRFAFSALASLAMMATSANAATILQFQQQNTALTPIVATNTASSTTLSSTGTGAVPNNPPGWIPVFVTILGAPVAQPAFVSFTTPLASSTGATSTAGNIAQAGYTGTIQFNFAPAPTPATNILTVTFANGLLTGLAGGNSASLSASSPPSPVNFASAIPQIQAALAAASGANFSLSFSGLTSALGLSGSTVGGFNASVAGTFSTTEAIPEPSSLLMASIPALMGMGFVGFRRRRQAS